MTVGIRPIRPPWPIYGSWAVSVLLGGLVLGRHLLDSPSSPRGLIPATLATQLRLVVPAGSSEIRVNGIYGSGHGGVWQFVAHLTWRTPTGEVTGGATDLPVLAGQRPLAPEFDASRLAAEEGVGLPLDTFAETMRAVVDVAAPLALVELEIAPTGEVTLNACHGSSLGPADCTRRDRHGTVTYRARLIDDPLQQALSVQRAS